MSILVVGGDDIVSIKGVLQSLGADEVKHWDGRKNHGTGAKSIPQDTDYLLMMTDFVNHNMMKKYKRLAKKDNIPIVYSKRSVSCVYGSFSKILGKSFA